MPSLPHTSGTDHPSVTLNDLVENANDFFETELGRGASDPGTHFCATIPSGEPTAPDTRPTLDADGAPTRDGTADGRDDGTSTSVPTWDPKSWADLPFDAPSVTAPRPEHPADVHAAPSLTDAVPPGEARGTDTGANGGVPVGTAGDPGTVANGESADEAAAPAPEPDLTLNDVPTSALTTEQRSVLETRGREFVDELESQEDDGLGGDRAGELRRNPELLEQIGALLGNEDEGIGERAASVLIGGVNGSTKDQADGHISGLARSGELDLGTFTALANDIDFLLTTNWLLHGPATQNGGLGAIDRHIDRAAENIAAGKDPMDNEAQIYPSRDGLLFHIPDAPQEKGDGTRNEAMPVYVNARGKPLPPEMQVAIAEQASTPEGIEPETLAEAKLLTDPDGVADSAGAYLAASSFQDGLIDLTTFREQLADPAFLESPETARAVDVLSGPDSPGEAFVGKLYRDGYVDTDTFIDYANDTTFIADAEAALATGRATFTSANNTDLDTLVDTMTDEDVKTLLGPGFDVADGPSGEQLAALYRVAGRSDQDFTELGIAWATESNPGLQLHYGYEENVHGDTPRGWFWRMDGEVIEDPFLDSLVQDFTFEDGSPVDKAFHKTRRNADDDGEVMPPSIPVQVHMEGVSGNEWTEGDFGDSRWKDSEETSAETDRVFALVFPDKDVEAVLERQTGYSVHYDDNNGTEHGNDGQNGKVRAAIDIVAPELLGWELTVASGGEGLEIVNSTRLGATGVIADDVDLDLDTSDNGGPLNIELSHVEGNDVTVEAGSGTKNRTVHEDDGFDVTELFIPDELVFEEGGSPDDPILPRPPADGTASTGATPPTIS